MGPASPGGTPTGGRAPHQGMVGSEPRPSTRSRQPGQRCPWGGPQGPCPEHCGRQHPAAHPQVGLSLRQTPASAHRLLAVRLSRGPSAPSPQRVRSSILLTTRGPPCSRGLSWEPVEKGRLWSRPRRLLAGTQESALRRCPTVEPAAGSPLPTLGTDPHGPQTPFNPTTAASHGSTPTRGPPRGPPSSGLLSPLPTSTSQPHRDPRGPQSSLGVRGWRRPLGRQDPAPERP